jgi:hypothetical protein
MVLMMGHLPGPLMLQKGAQRAHEISVEVDQQVSPSAYYDRVPVEAKTAISVKIQLKDPNNYPDYKQYPLKQEAKEGLQLVVKRFLKHGLLRPC